MIDFRTTVFDTSSLSWLYILFRHIFKTACTVAMYVIVLAELVFFRRPIPLYVAMVRDKQHGFAEWIRTFLAVSAQTAACTTVKGVKI